MKLIKTFLLVGGILSSQAFTQENQKAFTIEDYNANNLKHGVVFNWEYKPTFYTGFAPRVEEPSRIYVKASRGNITRVTTILDDRTVLTYLYNLKKRYEVFNQLVDEQYIKEYHLNQREMFNLIVESEEYQILPTIERYESGEINKSQFYAKSLSIMKQLIPERIRPIKFKLGNQFLQLQKNILNNFSQADIEEVLSKVKAEKSQTILQLNNILPGRINLDYATEDIEQAYTELIQKVLIGDDQITDYTNFFQLITKHKYDFKKYYSHSRSSESYDVMSCSSFRTCTLSYSEFTTIYPMGTVKQYVRDGEGNKIPRIQTTGAMTFHGRGHYDVDQIRGKTYYAWIPKMNYDRLGNGYHNPAVSSRISTRITLSEGEDAGSIKTVKELLNVPDEKGLVRLHVVARGGVSSGCNRLAAGHQWEMRNIFPSDPSRMTKVIYRGSNSKDYDLFDIDGDGTLEVMGVKYYIAYSLATAGASTIFKNPETGEIEKAKRNAGAYTGQSFNRLRFLTHLYGANQIKVDTDSKKVSLVDPSYSLFGITRTNKRDGYSGRRFPIDNPFSVSLKGEFDLYEQTYEQDKIQFYKMTNRKMFKGLAAEKGSDHTNEGKYFVRTLGRIVGCGPFKDEYCSEDSFDQQLKKSLDFVK